jgi:hypothetical protein
MKAINPAYGNTPLRIIGNVVSWHEDMATRGSKEERQRHAKIAKSMRKTVTDIFVARYLAGEYSEDTAAPKAA